MSVFYACVFRYHSVCVCISGVCVSVWCACPPAICVIREWMCIGEGCVGFEVYLPSACASGVRFVSTDGCASVCASAGICAPCTSASPLSLNESSLDWAPGLAHSITPWTRYSSSSSFFVYKTPPSTPSPPPAKGLGEKNEMTELWKATHCVWCIVGAH